MRIDDFIKLGAQSRQAAFTALIAIGAVAMYNWVVAPQVTYLRAVQEYRPVIDRIAQEKASLKDLLGGRRKALADLETQFSQLRPILYTSGQARQLWSDLEAMAAEQRCAVTTVDLSSNQPVAISGEERDALRVEMVNTSVTIVGDYDGIMAFVARLQAEARKIWVRAVAMEPVDPDAQRLQCRIDISIYMINEKETVSHD